MAAMQGLPPQRMSGWIGAPVPMQIDMETRSTPSQPAVRLVRRLDHLCCSTALAMPDVAGDSSPADLRLSRRFFPPAGDATGCSPSSLSVSREQPVLFRGGGIAKAVQPLRLAKPPLKPAMPSEPTPPCSPFGTAAAAAKGIAAAQVASQAAAASAAAAGLAAAQAASLVARPNPLPGAATLPPRARRASAPLLAVPLGSLPIVQAAGAAVCVTPAGSTAPPRTPTGWQACSPTSPMETAAFGEHAGSPKARRPFPTRTPWQAGRAGVSGQAANFPYASFTHAPYSSNQRALSARYSRQRSRSQIPCHSDPEAKTSGLWEAFGSIYKEIVAGGNSCTGPDSLPINDALHEIDLSHEFPPEKREAQVDPLAQQGLGQSPHSRMPHHFGAPRSLATFPSPPSLASFPPHRTAVKSL